MSKLEEAAEDPIRRYTYDEQYIFIAGARWLLEQASRIALDSMNETTARKVADMRAMSLVSILRDLCQSEKE